MPTVTLQAHYDGRHIVLDEPYDLPANAHLMVTLLPSSADTDSEEIWLRAASSSDAFAFLADPAEDIYTAADGKPFCDGQAEHRVDSTACVHAGECCVISLGTRSC